MNAPPPGPGFSPFSRVLPVLLVGLGMLVLSVAVSAQSEPRPDRSPRTQVTGTIVDELGDPISGAEVWVGRGIDDVDEDSRRASRRRSVRSSSDGRFALAGLPLSSFGADARLHAAAPRRVESWLPLHPWLPRSPVVEVGRIELAMAAEFRLTIQESSGAPAEGVEVTVTRLDSSRGRNTLVFGVTNAEGLIVFPNCPIGPVQCVVRPPGRPSWSVERFVESGTPRVIRLPSRMVRTAPLALVWEDLLPPTDDPEPRKRRVFWKASSGFDVAGFLEVEVRPDGSADLGVGQVPIGFYKFELRCEERRVASGQTLKVGAEGHRVGLRSSEGSSERVRGVIPGPRVQRPRSLLVWQQDESPRRIPVKENGDFEVLVQPDLPVSLCAGDFHRGVLVGTEARLAGAATATVQVETGDDGVPRLQVDCVRGADVVGRVLDEEGQPVAAQAVRLQTRGGGKGAFLGVSAFGVGVWTQTDEQGGFRFPALPIGTAVRLSITGGEFVGAVERELDGTPGGLQITVRKGATVEGLVPSPAGKPAAGYVVSLRRETGRVAIAGAAIGTEGAQLGRSDAEGRFRFRSVLPGRYVIQVSLPAQKYAKSQSFVVERGASGTVQVVF